MDYASFAREFPREGQQLEFKEGFSRTRLQEATAAFSNADGGVILIGVRNDGSVKGVAANGEREAFVHQLVASLHDPGRYRVHRLFVEELVVLALAVAPRKDGFTQTPDGRVLVRRGASNQALLGRRLSRLVAKRSLAHFEHTATAIPLSRVDQTLQDDLARACGWPEASVERLRESGLVVRDYDRERLTVAGTLYLSAHPERVLGKAFVEIFRYPGEGPRWDRRTEIAGPLTVQIRETTRSVLETIGTELVIAGLLRQELPRLPEAVLREAIVNAVAHRTYEASGTAVRVEIRPGRVVITSPGGLPEPVTVEHIREQCAARNPRVIRTLRAFGLAEDAGTGVDRMEDEMAINLLRPPVFEEPAGAEVRVTLRLDAVVTNRERAWVDELELGGDLQPTDRLLLVVAARGDVLNNSRAREVLGADHITARRALQRLRDHGLLIQTGERGGATYRISPSLPHTRQPLDETEVDELVLREASEGSISNSDVRRLTGLDRTKALVVLKRLVAAGHLVRRGERRGTRYLLARP